MNSLSGFVAALFSSVFLIFAIAASGSLLGRIRVKGISLGAAGILLAAVGYGLLAQLVPSVTIGGREIELFGASIRSDFAMAANLGSSIFIAAVGMSAGPDFFRSFSGRTMKYVALSVVIILTDILLAALLLRLDPQLSVEMCVGLLTGALTSTPGLSAAKEAASAASSDIITAGYGIAYLFGVIGVILFVQLTPKLTGLDMDAEKSKIMHDRAEKGERRAITNVISIDPRGFFPILLAVLFGCVLGAIRLPGVDSCFGTAGGTLISGLLLGHFGRCGHIDCRVEKHELNFLRQFGLVLFLAGSGVPAGINFLKYVQVSYFFYGVLMTLAPVFVGYVVAKKFLRLDMLNALSAITGGMTSTPALGALISLSGTDEISSAYAASYPTAMVLLVFLSKLIIAYF